MNSFLLFLYSTLIGLGSFSNIRIHQEDCVRERWIILYQNRNKPLFYPSTNTIDPFLEIKQLLLKGEIRLWTSRNDNNDDQYLLSPLPATIRDSVKVLKDLHYNPFFEYRIKGEHPLKDINGNDSVYTYPDGVTAFVYPLPEYAEVTFDKISELRIKEILVYDSVSKQEVMKPSMVGFDVYTTHHNILFWVMIDDLMKHIKINTEWINSISSKQYDGFIYRQYSCADPDYEWKEVYR